MQLVLRSPDRHCGDRSSVWGNHEGRAWDPSTEHLVVVCDPVWIRPRRSGMVVDSSDERPRQRALRLGQDGHLAQCLAGAGARISGSGDRTGGSSRPQLATSLSVGAAETSCACSLTSAWSWRRRPSREELRLCARQLPCTCRSAVRPLARGAAAQARAVRQPRTTQWPLDQRPKVALTLLLVAQI